MNLIRTFKKDYHKAPTHRFDCGGRFEILGNHTDHNHGLCLAATASLAITSLVAKRDDLVVNFDSFGFSNVNINLSNLDYDDSEKKSSAMIRGVAKYLLDHGYKIGGFDAVSSSTIFPGAGVSSSAAFQLLIGQIFNDLFNDGKIDKITLAKAGQYSENNYFGKASGLLDQIGVAFGNVVAIDFKDIENPKVEQIAFPFNDLVFIGVNTGGNHSSMNSLYSQIPLDMKNAAKKMGVNFLRDTTKEQFEKAENLSEIEHSRALHFYTEDERVLKAINALKNEDKTLFLQLINESRLSSTNNLKNMMVEGHYEGSPLEACDIAMSILGNEGACKINGGGFAGSIICAVPKHLVKKFSKLMSKKYGKENVALIKIREYGPRMF